MAVVLWVNGCRFMGRKSLDSKGLQIAEKYLKALKVFKSIIFEKSLIKDCVL